MYVIFTLFTFTYHYASLSPPESSFLVTSWATHACDNMSLHPPSITLPNGSTVSVLDDNLCLTIDTQPPATQRKVVRLLESYLQEAHAVRFIIRIDKNNCTFHHTC